MFTDKLVAKIPSTHDGVVKKINYKNDDICLVGHPLIEVEVPEGKEAATPQQEQPKKKVDAAEPAHGVPSSWP